MRPLIAATWSQLSALAFDAGDSYWSTRSLEEPPISVWMSVDILSLPRETKAESLDKSEAKWLVRSRDTNTLTFTMNSWCPRLWRSVVMKRVLCAEQGFHVSWGNRILIFDEKMTISRWMRRFKRWIRFFEKFNMIFLLVLYKVNGSCRRSPALIMKELLFVVVLRIGRFTLTKQKIDQVFTSSTDLTWNVSGKYFWILGSALICCRLFI